MFELLLGVRASVLEKQIYYFKIVFILYHISLNFSQSFLMLFEQLFKQKNLGNQSFSDVAADFQDRMRNLTCTEKLKTEKNISQYI